MFRARGRRHSPHHLKFTYLCPRQNALFEVRRNLHGREAMTKFREDFVMGIHFPGEKVDLVFTSPDYFSQVVDTRGACNF